MPDASSLKFVRLFESAVSRSGRLTQADVSALKSARRGITDVAAKAAADSILSMLSHDREFDSFEVAPTKKALQALLGVSRGPLPKDLEKVLRHAVPQSNAKVKNYDLSFDLAGPGPSFPAQAIVALEKPAGVKTILEIDPDRLDIQGVKVDGKAVPFKVKDGRLVVSARGAKTLAIQYTVKCTDAATGDAYGLIRNKYTGRMWTLTWPYNTGALFPSNSHPADGSTARVTVKVEGGAKVVGSGNKKDGSFVSAADAPAYAIAFYTAKDFELGNSGKSKDGVDVQGFGNGTKIPKALRDAYGKAAKDSLDFYSAWLGSYDYGDTLKLVEVEGELGGMEHTAAVAIMMGAARDPEYGRITAAHEVAHHWFGDNIRIQSWGDFWMSEGFTNYATYRFFRHESGDAKYFELLDQAKGEARQALQINPHALSAPAHTDVKEIFDSVSYEMGPWILRMMEVKLGTPKLDGLLRAWFQEKRGTSVSTNEFVAFAKAKTGTDFKAFFKEWNAIRAIPAFNAQVKATGTSVTVKLNAENEHPKSIEVPLRLEGAAGQSKTVMVKPGEAVKVNAGFEVMKWSWDPERTVLADVR